MYLSFIMCIMYKYGLDIIYLMVYIMEVIIYAASSIERSLIPAASAAKTMVHPDPM